MLGARPVDAGYATWIVQPQPGSLSWTVGQVPTPHGPLAVKWGRASGGEFDMGVTAPAGTSGTIAVPASTSTTAITVNGTRVWDHGTFSTGAGVTSARSDGSYVYLSVSASGDYHVAAVGGSGGASGVPEVAGAGLLGHRLLQADQPVRLGLRAARPAGYR